MGDFEDSSLFKDLFRRIWNLNASAWYDCKWRKTNKIEVYKYYVGFSAGTWVKTASSESKRVHLKMLFHCVLCEYGVWSAGHIVIESTVDCIYLSTLMIKTCSVNLSNFSVLKTELHSFSVHSLQMKVCTACPLKMIFGPFDGGRQWRLQSTKKQRNFKCCPPLSTESGNQVIDLAQ